MRKASVPAMPEAERCIDNSGVVEEAKHSANAGTSMNGPASLDRQDKYMKQAVDIVTFRYLVVGYLFILRLSSLQVD
jgi:hypothetical protein